MRQSVKEGVDATGRFAEYRRDHRRQRRYEALLVKYPQKGHHGVRRPSYDPQADGTEYYDRQFYFLPLAALFLDVAKAVSTAFASNRPSHDHSHDVRVAERDQGKRNHPRCHEKREDKVPLVGVAAQIVEAAAGEVALVRILSKAHV